MVTKIKELNRYNFAVRQHLKYVDLYSDKSAFEVLTYENTLQIAQEIAPLILPDEDEASAVRFDSLMYGIELDYIIGKQYKKARNDMLKKVRAIANISTIPEILNQKELIEKILHTDYLENSGINEFENIRKNIRDLVKYIPIDYKTIYNSNFNDDILSIDWHESELENDDLKNYKAKAAHYIRQHQDNIAIAKLKTNIPLSDHNIKQLEQILWSEIGSKSDYEHEFGNKPLGVFVREIVGLDMAAAKAAFSKYLDDVNLDSKQIYFVNQIVEYIVQNGTMNDLSVLQNSPFTDRGSIVEIFSDVNLWFGIKKVIEAINQNAMIA